MGLKPVLKFTRPRERCVPCVVFLFQDKSSQNDLVEYLHLVVSYSAHTRHVQKRRSYDAWNQNALQVLNWLGWGFNTPKLEEKWAFAFSRNLD